MDKNISYRSAEVLRILNEKNQLFFNTSDIVKILGGIKNQNIRRLLSDMTKRRLIMRIKGGLYTIIPYDKSFDYFPNWHIVAEKLTYPEEYYIGFYSALDIHGLITQPSLTEYIISNKQFTPKRQIINNVKFEFIKYNKNHFFGFEKKWISNYEKVFCSDLEKTIIDCLYKPQYASGVVEIVKAIDRSRKEININKMLDYLERFNADVVLKRLGFIMENFAEFDFIISSIENKISRSLSYLDPGYPKKGKYNNRCKIIDNVGIDEALNSLIT
ncbi:MAG: transcriptional regulator [Ignavibacteria bacterium]|nr:transcriptional regulator [Ignavibacteria bacterium]